MIHYARNDNPAILPCSCGSEEFVIAAITTVNVVTTELVDCEQCTSGAAHCSDCGAPAVYEQNKDQPTTGEHT